MGLFSSASKSIPWKDLTDLDQLEFILNDKSDRIHVLFKHSTRCGISSMAKKTFERGFEENEKVELWYLDLLQNRNISNEIANKTGVIHQSPQMIIIRNTEVLHDSSHHSIDAQVINNYI